MPTISQSELTFQSGGKPTRLDAYLPPDTPADPLPAVVALYGAGGNISGMEQYASMLAAQGFAVYLLHYFDRTGTESADKPTILRNFPLWMKTLWDAISFIETQPRADGKRIALLGFSLGAYLSLANSPIDHRVQAVVEFFGGMPKEIHLFMRRLCPVLILHGEADATVPVDEAYQLQKLLEKKGIPYEMKIYPGAGHGFEDQTIWRDAGLRSLQFLQKYLGA
ncbi:MAG: dienelactone hydrolase family protein [Terriglobales bacterium]|jgi:carboxymethylenebutenolidase